MERIVARTEVFTGTLGPTRADTFRRADTKRRYGGDRIIARTEVFTGTLGPTRADTFRRADSQD